MARTTSRRFLLRGMLAGTAVSVGLPFLDCFLNENGTALAAGGSRLPVRFGTWFWGCGYVKERWEPKATGPDYDLPPEIAALKPVQRHVSVLTGFNVPLDGKSLQPHTTGNIGLRTGAPQDNWQQIQGPTFDVAIADVISTGSYFRSLELSADGNPRTSYSFRSATAMNPGVPSAAELYQKVFGPDFQDPNAADFKPDPRIMVRRSVLSGVTDERQKLLTRVGAEDRARLDQYFTSLREVEQKLELQLQKPPPAEACSVPQPSKDQPVANSDVAARKASHRAMAQLLAMALACNQTKVFNVAFSVAASDLRQVGQSTGHHQATHEELVDRQLGYQPAADFFSTRSMEAWSEFVAILAGIPEGPGTLLDNTLVLAHSDVSFAKTHDIDGIPMMLAGRAGGVVKPGIHVRGGGEPVSRVVLTVQQAMGVPTDRWGSQSMRTSRAVSEILA